MEPSSLELRQNCIDIFGATPAPVAMLTLHVDGRPWGVTVSSVVPVTMDPPKLLVSLFSESIAARHILLSSIFGVSMLSSGHTLVARAQARPNMPKFLDAHCRESDLPDHAEFGASGGSCDPAGERSGFVLPPPRLARAAHFDCQVVETVHVDDHLLLIGRVTAAQRPSNSIDPLLYVAGGFARAHPLAPEPLAASPRSHT